MPNLIVGARLAPPLQALALRRTKSVLSTTMASSPEEREALAPSSPRYSSSFGA